MKKLLFVLLCGVLGICNVAAQGIEDLKFYNVIENKEFVILGRALDVPRDTSVAGLDYGRLPLDRKDGLRTELWSLGLNCAGMSLRFRTDSPIIGVKWQPLNNFAMNHMTATGVRGLDIYVQRDGQWVFAGSAIPSNKPDCSKIVVRNMEEGEKEFMVHLPLYDGLRSLEIGFAEGSHLSGPSAESPLNGKENPVIFYGTSITQGGCASRAGMGYTAIFQRLANKEAVNLGFSGNARMDKSIEDILIAASGCCYFIDCMPNCTQDMVEVRGYAFMHSLLSAKTGIPFFMVEQQMEPPTGVDVKSRETIAAKNALWYSIYERLRGEGFTNLHYITAAEMIGTDGEHTVDGCHFTDLGFSRAAHCFFKAYSSL